MKANVDKSTMRLHSPSMSSTPTTKEVSCFYKLLGPGTLTQALYVDGCEGIIHASGLCLSNGLSTVWALAMPDLMV